MYILVMVQSTMQKQEFLKDLSPLRYIGQSCIVLFGLSMLLCVPSGPTQHIFHMLMA